MSYYAVVNTTTDIVDNIIVWDGVTEYDPGEGYILVETDSAGIGWSYAAGVLSPPPVIPPTPEEILQYNTITQESLLGQASQAMAPVLVSLQLGDATDAETTTAKAWQAYYRALKVVDLTVESPAWPAIPS